MLRWLFLLISPLAAYGLFNISNQYDKVSYVDSIAKCLSQNMVPATYLDFVSNDNLKHQIANRFPDLNFWLVEQEVLRPNDIEYWKKLMGHTPTQCSKMIYAIDTGFYWNMEDCTTKLNYICKPVPKPSFFNRIKKMLSSSTKKLSRWLINLLNPNKPVNQTSSTDGKLVDWIDLDGTVLKVFVSAEHNQLNFDDAIKSCLERDMDPMYVRNAREDRNVLKIIGNVLIKENKISDLFWTGGFRTIRKREDTDTEVDDLKDFMWLPSFKPFTYEQWKTYPMPNQPCVKIKYHIAGSGWYTDYCDKRFRYLCKKKHDEFSY